MSNIVRTSDDGVDPVEYVRSYFTHLTDKEISVLVGSLILLKEVEYSVLKNVLNLEQLEVEEKIGRLMQTDLLEGKFTKNSFILNKFNYPIKKQNPNLSLDDRVLLAYLKARYIIKFEELERAFDLNYKTAIYVLSKFISQGLLTPKMMDDGFEIIVHYKLPKRSATEITNLEKQIVGLSLLRENITIQQLVEELEEPEFKIQGTLVNLILADLVTCEFEIQNKIFGGFEVFIHMDNFQVQFNKRQIQVLEDNERAVIGLVGLRRQLEITEISQAVGLSNTEVLKILTQLIATNQFRFKLRNETVVLDQQIDVTPSRSLDTLSSISSFNYRVLIGIIKTQKSIKIKTIANKMRENPYDVLRALIDLYLEGLIKGYLDNNLKFTLQAVKRVREKEDITLADWERILLGALIAEEVLAWPKIAALLEYDRIEARDRAFEFLANGFSKTYAKDTVVVMEKVPQLPPLSQVNDLDFIDQQLLGYIMAVPNFNLKQIRSIFNFSSKEAFRHIYYLSGSGLAIIKRNNSNFRSKINFQPEPIKSITDLDEFYQNIIEIIQNDDMKVFGINEFANKLDVGMNEMTRSIGFLIAHGYYKGKIIDKQLRIESGLKISKTHQLCFNCETEFELNLDNCPNCDYIIPSCTVCKGKLHITEKLVVCPHCQHMGHSNHLGEWLKIKGQCPVCKNKLTQRQLIVRDATIN